MLALIPTFQEVIPVFHCCCCCWLKSFAWFLNMCRVFHSTTFTIMAGRLIVDNDIFGFWYAHFLKDMIKRFDAHILFIDYAWKVKFLPETCKIEKIWSLEYVYTVLDQRFRHIFIMLTPTVIRNEDKRPYLFDINAQVQN